MSQAGNAGIHGGGGGGNAVETLTGNVGGPVPPTAHNINIITADTTVLFSGSGSTLTLGFNVAENLCLGTSLPSLTSGINNFSLSHDSLNNLTSGSANIAIGQDAATYLTEGNNNILIGEGAGSALTTSNYNVCLGLNTLTDYTTSPGNNGYNTAIGAQTYPRLTTGAYNVGIGGGTGSSATGYNYTGAESSNILIDNAGVLGDNNTIRIGTQGTGSGQQSTCYVAGIVGNTVSNQEYVTINSSTGQLGVVSGIGTQVVSSVQNVGIGSGAQTSITSIDLAAGTWDINLLLTLYASGPNMLFISASISTVNNAFQGNLGDQQVENDCVGALQQQLTISIPQFRVTPLSTTTYYLVAETSFGSGSAAAYGRISAVKMG
jgi:hypothetical protein